jgi:hypothetical protein
MISKNLNILFKRWYFFVPYYSMNFSCQMMTYFLFNTCTNKLLHGDAVWRFVKHQFSLFYFGTNQLELIEVMITGND